jgi:hypothetical protein
MKKQKIKSATVTITKENGDNLTAEELRAVGEMVEEGYRQGVSSPYGLDWELEIEYK